MSGVLSYLKRGARYVLLGQPERHVTARVAEVSRDHTLAGRRALVTGGTSGIGEAIARALLRAGSGVVITGRDEGRLRGAAERLASEGAVETLRLDMRDVEAFDDAVARLAASGQPIDILVNNAGLVGGDISTCTPEQYDDIMATNLRGAFFLSRSVARQMIGAGVRGNILNVASRSSLRPASSAYTASKWGLRGLTLGLAKSLAPHDIVVNGVAPGPTATPMLHHADRSELRFEGNPAGRFALPEEIAGMAVVLVSDMARMVVGDIVYMTGGAGLVTFDDVSYTF